MTYIRMTDHLEELYIDEFTEFGKEYYKNSKIADTIEELCDELVMKILLLQDEKFFVKNKGITQEEYDLLKEVLGD